MNIVRHLKVPTGDILVVQSPGRPPLEMLSLGDYGQAVNLNQHQAVPDGLPLLPLTEKWVVTVSTQHGCSMGCSFCDVPKVGPGINASLEDLNDQIEVALHLPNVPQWTKRLNVHFARMGEPTFNPNVLICARLLSSRYRYNPHPVVSTMMPKGNGRLEDFIREWMTIKNDVYGGNAGLQLSINSTDPEERRRMFNGHALSLSDISAMMRRMPRPKGRKITLNFAVADYFVDTDLLAHLFPTHLFIVKLTPMHKTSAAVVNGIQTEGDYTAPEPYLELEARFKRSGFDVLTFIASREEDEGRITCGNAILSGTVPHRYTEVPL